MDSYCICHDLCNDLTFTYGELAHISIWITNLTIIVRIDLSLVETESIYQARVILQMKREVQGESYIKLTNIYVSSFEKWGENVEYKD